MSSARAPGKIGPVNRKYVWLALLAAVFLLSRWPGLMPLNFSVAYALVFCAGLYLPGWKGWAVPLGLMVVSDCFLNFFFYHDSHFPLGQLPCYLAYVWMIGLGRVFARKSFKKSWWALVGGGIVAAYVFYFVTNTAAWLELSYQKTLAGWIQAITIGLPGYPQTWEFFRNTLLSGGLFTGLFVGAAKMAEAKEKDEEEEGAEEPDGESAEAEG